MKRLIQGFIAGVAFSSAITGLALSNRNSITAVKSRVKKGAEDLKDKAKRTIKVEGDNSEDQTAEESTTVTPEYSHAETEEPRNTSYKKRSEVRGYRKSTQS